MLHSEWHDIPTIFTDRAKRQRQVTAKSLVFVAASEAWSTRHIPTGLAYFKLREPMYLVGETGTGYYGFYYPLHLASHEQLLASCWSNEPTIQWFLQQLATASSEPD